MRFRKFLALAALALAAVLPLTSQAQQVVRVGSKNFTEQFVLAEIYAQALEAAGIKTEKKLNLGGTLIAQKARVHRHHAAGRAEGRAHDRPQSRL